MYIHKYTYTFQKYFEEFQVFLLQLLLDVSKHSIKLLITTPRVVMPRGESECGERHRFTVRHSSLCGQGKTDSQALMVQTTMRNCCFSELTVRNSSSQYLHNLFHRTSYQVPPKYRRSIQLSQEVKLHTNPKDKNGHLRDQSSCGQLVCHMALLQ